MKTNECGDDELHYHKKDYLCSMRPDMVQKAFRGTNSAGNLHKYFKQFELKAQKKPLASPDSRNVASLPRARSLKQMSSSRQRELRK